MFRVTETIRLEDLLRTFPVRSDKFPVGTLPSPPSSPTTPTVTTWVPGTPTKSRLSVVGQERGGFLLVAVTTGTRTDVSALETKSLTWTPLVSCEIGPRADVVWATVNSDRTIVALTIRYIGQPPSSSPASAPPSPAPPSLSPPGAPSTTSAGTDPEPCYFETTVEAVGESPKRLFLHDRTRTPQRAQYLFDVPDRKQPVSHFLVTVVGESLSTHSVSYARTASGVTVKAPKREVAIVGSHLWSHLAQRAGLLYFVVARSTGKDRGGTSQQALRILPISAKKVSLKAAVEHSFSSCIGVTQHNFASPAFETFPLPYTLGIGSRQAPPLPYVRVVTLEGGALCLCVQHDYVTQNSFPVPSIPVTIIALHLRLRVDFSIPVSNVNRDVLRSMRVIFDSIADFLVIYIPGHHLHLFDLSELHNPIPGVVVTEADATPLPIRTVSAPLAASSASALADSPQLSEVSVAALDLLNVSEPRAGPDVAGHSFLDLGSGVVFEFSFDRKRLLQMFETPNTELHIQLLHMACIHMEDMELVHQIIMHTLNTKPENARVSLLKEFLVGAAFQTLRGRVPYHILLGVPATTSDQQELLMQALRKKPALENVSVVSILQPPISTKPGLQAKETYQLRQQWGLIERMRPMSQSASRLDGRPEDRDVIVYFKSLFGGSNTMGGASVHPYLRIEGESAPPELRATLPDSRTLHGETTDQALAMLTSEIMNLFAKESRPAAQGYAAAYMRCQNDQAEVLFTYIVQSFSERQEPRQRLLFFQALENMFCAVSELGGICVPRGFYQKFALLSFECLPESVFLQYVERGVIRITVEVVCELQERKLQETNPEFFFHLLCKLPSQSIIAVLLNQQRPPYYLIEHFFSKNSQLLMSSGRLDLGTCCEDSPFIPLSLLLRTLYAQAQPMLADPGANAFILPHALDYDFMAGQLDFEDPPSQSPSQPRPAPSTSTASLEGDPSPLPSPTQL